MHYARASAAVNARQWVRWGRRGPSVVFLSSLLKNGENPVFFSFSIFFSFRVTEKKMEMKKEKEVRKWKR